jgi:hypothetical protein
MKSLSLLLLLATGVGASNLITKQLQVAELAVAPCLRQVHRMLQFNQLRATPVHSYRSMKASASVCTPIREGIRQLESATTSTTLAHVLRSRQLAPTTTKFELAHSALPMLRS